MARRYTVNGQEMSEEEFRNFTNGANAFGDSGFWNFEQRKQKRWDHKPHLYQCYKDTAPNRWNEITFDEFKKDFNKSPKFTKEFAFVQMANNEYIIQSCPVVAIFYNHTDDTFHYMKPDGVISEHNCFNNYDEAYNAVIELENKKCGKHTLFSASNEIIKVFMPDFNDDSSIENTTSE